MEIECYLAMTAAEIRQNFPLPPKISWMACHFSPYGTGLSNLPEELPEGSMLILNDRTPWMKHDADLILEQLRERLDIPKCSRLLLDFQRPGIPEVMKLTKHLVSSLPCPVGVSEPYAADFPCPVFLPPVPLQQTVEEYLTPWQGRDIWLELALDCEEIFLTPTGAASTALPFFKPHARSHREEALHCHYCTQVEEDAARFTLYRTQEDLDTLLKAAASFGLTTAVGLWQELSK